MGEVSVEQRLDVLERQVRSLRVQAQQMDEWVDTLASPPWKKFWWLMQGWRWYRLGRWRGN